MSQGAEVLAPYKKFLTRPVPTVAADLESFASLLLKWNRTQNLVSRETVSDLWPRHIADSLQVLPLLRESDRKIIDLGSGGGFPAIPLAIASKGARDFTLVEPIGKKASFLRTAGRALDLGLDVEAVRVQELKPTTEPPQIVTSRALTSLTSLLALAAIISGPTTRGIFHKGREHVDELAESRAVWQYDVIVHPSRTDRSGVLLEISNLRSK